MVRKETTGHYGEKCLYQYLPRRDKFSSKYHFLGRQRRIFITVQEDINLGRAKQQQHNENKNKETKKTPKKQKKTTTTTNIVEEVPDAPNTVLSPISMIASLL